MAASAHARTSKRKAEQFTAAEEELGKLAVFMSEELARKGWRRTISDARGKSNIAHGVHRLLHPAARLLEHLRARGASVPMTSAPWDAQRCDDAVTRGPHQSSQGERQFVHEEMLDFCRQGYWIVLPYQAVADMHNLRLSPLGVVPQRDRRPRLIVDYSFSGVNEDTITLAPREAMQFGRALQRIVSKIVHADLRYGPVFMAKIDIADGFYRVWLQVADILKLGVVLPTAPSHLPLIAFPLALPMGWVESPPYFTALTETVCDLANNMLSTNAPRLAAPHRLETVAATPPPASALPHSHPIVRQTTRGLTVRRRPLAAVDVYVDDFLLLAQTATQQRRVLRAALHSIDDVFRPLEPDDPGHRKEPASVKKMLQGDAFWSPQKRMLGWDVDSHAMTLNLPAHRLARLREVLTWLQPPRKRLSRRKWHQLLGELRSMSPALPGTRGLFSVLQAALSKGDNTRVRLNQQVYDTAADFSALVNSLAARPTRLQELVPTPPSHVGACDACQVGMGGVWLASSGRDPPVVWRQRFPVHIQQALVTAANRKGAVSISDLELAGLIAHKDILAQAHDIRERTIWIASDNRAAVSWATKGSATSLAARAYLLQYNALHQRQYRSLAQLLLATAPPAARDQLRRDWSALHEASRHRVSRQRGASALTSWDHWAQFCASVHQSPTSISSLHFVPLLQLFAQRYRSGACSPGGHPVRSRTVEDALRAVGQTYARMGAPDPRLDRHGNLDIRITSLFRAWAKDDPPPRRVKPLPLPVLAQVWAAAHAVPLPDSVAAAHMLALGFFFLLRPGEYLGRPPPPPASGPLFRVEDIQLWIGSRALHTFQCTDAELLSATFVSFTFTEQKNGVRNETIGHGRSGHSHLCPVLVVAQRLLYLRTAGATPRTPLNAARPLPASPFRYILASDLTKRIRAAVVLHPDPAYTVADVSVRSTRAGGAMASTATAFA